MLKKSRLSKRQPEGSNSTIDCSDDKIIPKPLSDLHLTPSLNKDLCAKLSCQMRGTMLRSGPTMTFRNESRSEPTLIDLVMIAHPKSVRKSKLFRCLIVLRPHYPKRNIFILIQACDSAINPKQRWRVRTTMIFWYIHNWLNNLFAPLPYTVTSRSHILSAILICNLILHDWEETIDIDLYEYTTIDTAKRLVQHRDRPSRTSSHYESKTNHDEKSNTCTVENFIQS